MAAEVLVVMEFYDADQTQRNAFAAQFSARRWKHHPALANAYITSFNEGYEDAVMVAASEIDIDHATRIAGIEQWDATCIVGDPGWLPELACCA